MVDSSAVPNLYVHFPFCRRKCTYCNLFSAVGKSEAKREEYVARLVEAIEVIGSTRTSPFNTVYFGGGSPTLCELQPLFAALAPYLTKGTEFTVEVHPEDATDERLGTLAAGGVNRLSMGVQSTDDRTLEAMGRGYTLSAAREAFERARRIIPNAGIDLIIGYPGDPCDGFAALKDWGLKHCSVYALQNERGLEQVPDDEWVLDRLRETVERLAAMGLERYEISNYAAPGYECKHNSAVWAGEDYLGLGDGAAGRVGLKRTRNWWGGGVSPSGLKSLIEQVDARTDRLERRIFALRTRKGLNAADAPQWHATLDAAVKEGLLKRDGRKYCLTLRGTEVCDSILAELI